jgi:SAM-dependent methyltransferase
MSPSTPTTFSKSGVADYERRRYRGLDQRIVHGRERRVLRRFFRRTGAGGGRVLDAPCGYGRFSELCLSRGGPLVGADLSLNMVKRALDASPAPDRHAGAVADFKAGLPFKPGAFEVVFSMRLFHHIHDREDRRRILAEFGRVAGRWAIVSFYKMNAFHALQRAVRRGLLRKRRKIKMVPWPEFKADCEAAGFVVRGKKGLLPGVHAQHILLLEKARS